jgi:uncharacterized membrane protein YbhN (UPF0104 family)
MTALTLVVIIVYAGFVQWLWGWANIAGQWARLGTGHVLIAILLLTSTYFLRTWRIRDYFPHETAGRYGALFRVTQIHNIVNIMLPFRAGETSFPMLMRSEFGIPLLRGTSALLVMRLLDLHALLAAAGVGPASQADRAVLGWGLWLIFLLLPLAGFAGRAPLLRAAARVLPGKAQKFVVEIGLGLPADLSGFARAWGMTVVNWLVKVLVLAWVLGLLGVGPLAASFGGALGGELSSVLPMHAPGGVGTYPAGITAGAIAFGARSMTSVDTLAQAGVNAHLLILVSALTGTALSLLTGRKPRG